MGGRQVKLIAPVAPREFLTGDLLRAGGLASGIPFTPGIPSGPAMLAFKGLPWVWSAFSAMLSAFFTIFAVLYLVGRIVTSCSGRTSKWMTDFHLWMEGYEIKIRTRRAEKAQSLAVYLLFTSVLIAFKVLVLVLEGFVRVFALFVGWSPILLLLFLLAYALLHLETYPDLAMSHAYRLQLTQRKAWNVGGAFLNLFLDVNNAILVPLYNISIKQVMAFVEVTYTYVVLPLISADGDFSNNPFYDEGKAVVEGAAGVVNDIGAGASSVLNDVRDGATGLLNDVKSTVSFASGRRQLQQPASLGIANGQQLFQLVHAIMKVAAFIFDLIGFIKLQIYTLILQIIYPVIPYIGDIIANVFKLLGCIGLSPVCAFLEGIHVIVGFAVDYVNFTFVAAINQVGSVFGDSTIIDPIQHFQIACSEQTLGNGVPYVYASLPRVASATRRNQDSRYQQVQLPRRRLGRGRHPRRLLLAAGLRARRVGVQRGQRRLLAGAHAQRRLVRHLLGHGPRDRVHARAPRAHRRREPRKHARPRPLRLLLRLRQRHPL